MIVHTSAVRHADTVPFGVEEEELASRSVVALHVLPVTTEVQMRYLVQDKCWVVSGEGRLNKRGALPPRTVGACFAYSSCEFSNDASSWL